MKDVHVSMVCAIAALCIAVTGHDGWEWFLFVAVLCL